MTSLRSHRHLDPVTLPDGTTVWSAAYPTGGYGRDTAPDFGLYLDPLWRPPWPHDHVDWEDFGLPADLEEMALALDGLLDRARAGERVEVGCLGGHGRTGTALAWLAVRTGLDDDPVVWVRAHYCHLAIETDDQVALARSFTTGR